MSGTGGGGGMPMGIPGLDAEASEEAKTAETAWQAAAEGGKQGFEQGAKTTNPYIAAAGLVVGAAKGAMQHGAASNKRRAEQHQERYAPKKEAAPAALPVIEGYEYDPKTGKYVPTTETEGKQGMLNQMGEGGMFADAIKGMLQGNQGGGDKKAGGLFAQLQKGMGAAAGG